MSFARVIVDLPLDYPLDYRIDDEDLGRVAVGARCVVPVGGRPQVGLVIGQADHSDLPPDRLRAVTSWLDEPRLSPAWLEFTRFAADYYHQPWGTVALPALPRALRAVPRPGTRRRPAGPGPGPAGAQPRPAPARLRAEQEQALGAITAAPAFAAFLLHGITGSGKTEVYLGALARVLSTDPAAQALFLVPEINLTPQLEAWLRGRFPGELIVSMHSGLGDAERARAWLAAHRGEARVVLGTRLAVFASLQRLSLVIVDEEHDTSFKAGDGARYSARDLAVKRAQLEGAPVVLGSATPSLESWQLARSGRYHLLTLSQRASTELATAPCIETVDLREHRPQQGLAPPLRSALAGALERGEQALLFINRRGYAPVLACEACGWLSGCPRCEVYAAYHKSGGMLRCHHCGWSQRVPDRCPTCGNQDLVPVGQGTQRVEEALRAAWPQARIARIDRDNTRRAGAAQRTLEAVHEGKVDILVGTQMIAKGHDFRRVTTVGVLNTDAQLVAPDFRAPERLFALLMQVAGRAGRAGQASRVLIQTRYPGHPLFAALARQDYAAFAAGQLEDRQQACMPPFVHQALLTASARSMDEAIEFLRRCRQLADELQPRAAGPRARVEVYDAVPMPLARLAAQSRAQLLVESARRPQLHGFLDRWLPALRAGRAPAGLRWQLEIDPATI